METILIPDKFNNSKDLLKALNKKKFYCFTNFMSVRKICENVEINNFGMKSILHKDKITIIFTEKDELTFFNNSTGLIEKSLLKPIQILNYQIRNIAIIMNLKMI